MPSKKLSLLIVYDQTTASPLRAKQDAPWRVNPGFHSIPLDMGFQ
jgi:hypothetical protein